MQEIVNDHIIKRRSSVLRIGNFMGWSFIAEKCGYVLNRELTNDNDVVLWN